MADAVAGRRHGVPEGRTERVERIVRATYPDGTTVDGEPTVVAGSSSFVATWSSLAGSFTRLNEPVGTVRTVFARTVVTEATPWTEVGPAGSPELVDKAARRSAVESSEQPA